MKILRCCLRRAPLVLVVPLIGCAGPQSAPPVTLSIHLQTSDQMPPRLVRPVQLDKPRMMLLVKSTSELTEVMLDRAEIDYSAGGPYVRLVFGEHGRLVLRSLTTEHRNRYLVFIVNGRPLAAHYITRTIDDGILTMFADLPEQEVKKIVAGLQPKQLEKLRAR
jgi:hypothetical protein